MEKTPLVLGLLSALVATVVLVAAIQFLPDPNLTLIGLGVAGLGFLATGILLALTARTAYDVASVLGTWLVAAILLGMFYIAGFWGTF